MRNSGGLRSALLTTIIASALVFVAMFATNAATAGAQGSCAEDFGQFDVSTADEFNFAIDCFNSATFNDDFANVNVYLLANIEAETVSGNSVFVEFTQQNQTEFTIEGNGYTIRRGADAPTTLVPLFSVAPGAGTSITIFETDFEVGLFDTHVLYNDGTASRLGMWASSIAAGPNGTDATGVFAGLDTDEHDIAYSWFSGVTIGLDGASPAFGVSSSTINATEIDIAAAPGGGFGYVADSTLAGPIGVQGGNSRFDIDNSTVLGDGANFPPGTAGGALIRSSIIASCSSPELDIDGQAGGGYIDLGNNVGGCFEAGVAVDIVLADNGCEYPTPRGCAPSVALSTNSPAIGAGLCGESANGNTTDQRGAPRTPVGAGCDAGSFEFGSAPPPCATANGSFAVATAAELDIAIGCFNNADPSDPNYEITLLNDIDALGPAGNAVLTEIAHPYGKALTIEGDGHTIRRGAGGSTVPAPILRMSSESSAIIDLLYVGFELGEFDTAAIHNDGFTRIALLAGSITSDADRPGTTGIYSGPKALDLLLGSAYITGVDVGVQILGSGWNISSTTIESTNVDVLLEGDGFGIIETSTLAGPVGIQLPNSGGSNVDYTTVLGDAAAIVGDAQGGVSFTSSIIASCSAPVVEPFGPSPGPQAINLGSNVGGCFDQSHVIDTVLADNGCFNETPVGCAPTVGQSVTSTAIGAGDCTNEEFDQRGERRTPEGPGCDAGSVETNIQAACYQDDDPTLVRTSFQVFDADGLNEAIDCINRVDPQFRAPAVITLLNDVAATELGDDAVFSVIDNQFYSRITIDGNGHTIRRDPGAGNGDESLPVLSYHVGDDAVMVVKDLAIEVGTNDTAGISGTGTSTSAFDGSLLAIRPGPSGSQATGLDINHDDGFVTVTTSFIDGLPIGAQLTGGVTQVQYSTIASTETDLIFTGDAFAPIVASTFTAPVAIDADTGIVILRWSTAVGDVAPARPGTSAIVSVESSIIGSCTSSVSTDPDAAGPVVINSGGNVGGCVAAGDVIDTVLADNGCISTTPAGCTPTIALGPLSPARGAGVCGTNFGAASIDQRGFPRSPLAAGCDAGSFEDLGCDGVSEFMVNDEGSFNVALTCFNQATEVLPSGYTITLDADITLTRSDGFNPLDSSVSVGGFSAIAQPSSDLSVTIDAAGFALRSAQPVATLLRLGAGNSASVTITDAEIDQGQVQVSTLVNDGTGGLTIVNTAFVNGDTFFPSDAVRSTGAPLTVDNSIVQAASVGLSNFGGDVTVTNSSIDSRAAVGATQSNNLLIENSTLTSQFSGVTAPFATGVVRNTTFNGAAIYGNLGDVDVDVFSSYFTADCPQGVQVLEGNAGTCFSGSNAEAILPLADNGCLVATPAGCVPTAALDADSIAIGAGFCDVITTDQRGEPRTPLGDGCDAGAYELAGFVPPDMGDVDANGFVDNDDVQALLVFIAGGDPPAGIDVADMNDDGEINLADALLLAQMVADPG